MALRIHRPIAGNSFDEKQPIALYIVKCHARHLAMVIDCDPKGSQSCMI